MQAKKKELATQEPRYETSTPPYPSGLSLHHPVSLTRTLPSCTTSWQGILSKPPPLMHKASEYHMHLPVYHAVGMSLLYVLP